MAGASGGDGSGAEPVTARGLDIVGREPVNDWSDQLRGFVLGIALARSVVVQDVARTFGGLIKTVEGRLSNFLGQDKDRLQLLAEHRRYVIAVLRKMGRKRFVWHAGKLVLIGDTTGYLKLRSRGKERAMPRAGKTRVHNLKTDEVVLGPAYQEMWTGLLLRRGWCLGITRKLFTENMEFFTSQPALELAEIRYAVELVREAFNCRVILERSKS